MPTMSSPIRKLSTAMNSKPRPIRVLLLGQSAVGKTALTVRFITKRFIGEYDPTLEQKYSCTESIGGDTAHFEILDTAGQDEDQMRWEENIKWADSFILLYSITDSLSFDECTRYKFLINHIKRKRKISVGALAQSHDIPVALVGNQTDLKYDRMVSTEDGQRRSDELGCTHFFEISVRESYQDVFKIFEHIYRDVKVKKHTTHHRMNPPSPPENRARAFTVVSEGGVGSSDFATYRPLRRSTTTSSTKSRGNKMPAVFSSRRELKRSNSFATFT